MKKKLPIDAAMEKAIQENVFPGAALLVAKKGQILHRNFYGHATLLPRPELLTEKIIFDIASLTKPVATASIALLAVQENSLSLNTPVSNSFTPEHLLRHTSGLPAWKAYYQELAKEHLNLVGHKEAREWYWEHILQEPLENPPGIQRVYSDLGFILLGIFLENFFKKSLDQVFDEKIAKPMKLTHTFFVPAGQKRSDQVFAATENSVWRKKLIRGEVHDDNAYALGGVAGHAGLFSTVDDLHRFCLETVKQKKKSVEEYELGWDTPSPKDSQSGKYFSKNSIGHLGYSGCSLWIDFDQDFHVILLTNRVHPTSQNEKIKVFRPQLHNLIYEQLIQ